MPLLCLPGPITAFTRFATNGAGVALVAIGTYGFSITLLGLAPLAANLLAYLTQLVVGYQVHRLFSFDRSAMTRVSMMRYAILSVGAFLLNSLWVWLLTEPMRLPAWSAIVPMIALTPVVTFHAGRHWVFAPTASTARGLNLR